MLLPTLLALASVQSPWSTGEPTAAAAGSIGTDSVTLTKADLNGDGLDDILSVPRGGSASIGNRVTASLSLGNGSFGLQVNSLENWAGINGSFIEPSVAVGDLNSDGFADLVFQQRSGGTYELQVADGDGTGRFGLPRLVGTSSYLRFATTADLDQDGHLDLVIGEATNTRRAMGQGGGLFGPLIPLLDAPLRTSEMLAEDLTGDGVTDLVLLVNGNPSGNPLSNTASLITGTGTLPFDTSAATVLIDSPLDHLWVGDLEGDGDQDLLASFFSMPFMVENQGSSTFAQAQALPFEIGGLPLEAHDLDGDGLLDLFAIRNDGISTSLQTSPLSFGPVRVEQAADLRGGVTLDANGDGVVDVAVGQPEFGPGFQFTRAFQAHGARTTQGEYSLGAFRVLEERVGWVAPAAADVDGDGLSDLFGLDMVSGAFGMKRNLGDGEFAPAVLLAELGDLELLGTTSEDVFPLVADFTGDGVMDVVYVEAGERNIYLRSGDGAGGFAPAVVAGTAPFLLADWEAKDIDADGISDLVWTTRSRTALYYSFGSPSGALTAPASVSGGQFPTATAFALGDLDGDGDSDLLFNYQSRIEVSFLGSQRAFGARAQVGTVASTGFGSKPVLVDLDRDNVLDLVLLSFFVSTDWVWLQGLGGGSFGPAVGISPGAIRQSPQFGDWDHDGDLDFLLTTEAPFFGLVNFGYVENAGGGSFLPPVAMLTNEATVSSGEVAFGDVDSDDDLDLIVCSAAGVLHVATNDTLGDVGQAYCGPAVPNSTSASAELRASGSANLSLNHVTLRGTSLPPQSFGYFLTSQIQGFQPSVPASVGALCLAGPIGRFIDATEIQQASAAGTFSLRIDLTAIPDPVFGLVPVLAGETWNFQAWYRDTDGMGGATSNFTDALSVTF